MDTGNEPSQDSTLATGKQEQRFQIQLRGLVGFVLALGAIMCLIPFRKALIIAFADVTFVPTGPQVIAAAALLTLARNRKNFGSKLPLVLVVWYGVFNIVGYVAIIALINISYASWAGMEFFALFGPLIVAAIILTLHFGSTLKSSFVTIAGSLLCLLSAATFNAWLYVETLAG